MSILQDPRVLFAAERTLLAWNRTSLALIAFGFLVERTGILIQTFAPDSPEAKASGAAFWLGLAFIALGVFAASYSSRQYLVVLKSLSREEYPTGYTAKWGTSINILVAVLGSCLALVLYFGRAL